MMKNCGKNGQVWIENYHGKKFLDYNKGKNEMLKKIACLSEFSHLNLSSECVPKIRISLEEAIALTEKKPQTEDVFTVLESDGGFFNAHEALENLISKNSGIIKINDLEFNVVFNEYPNVVLEEGVLNLQIIYDDLLFVTQPGETIYPSKINAIGVLHDYHVSLVSDNPDDYALLTKGAAESDISVELSNPVTVIVKNFIREFVTCD